MRRILLAAGLTVLLLNTTGCATFKIIGNDIDRTATVFGDVGLTGDNIRLTVVPGSKIRKLSIIGDGCTVTIMEDVTLNKIEFWGMGNTVSIPDYLVVRSNEVGTNQIIRRVHETPAMPEWSPPPVLEEDPMLTAPPPAAAPRPAASTDTDAWLEELDEPEPAPEPVVLPPAAVDLEPPPPPSGEK